MEFKDVFKKLRKSRGYSQSAIADKLHLSKSLIGAYETGDRKPSFETLEIIADFFNVDINYLMGRENKSTYYLDPEAAELAQEMLDRPELKTLFKASRKVSADDLRMIQAMIERFADDDSVGDDVE